MKTTLAAMSFLLLMSGLSTRAQGPGQAQPAVLVDAAIPGSADRILSFYQVTSMICVQDSSGQSQRVFVNVDIKVGQLNTDRYKLMLSSSPNSDAPYIVDDAVFVSGQKFVGQTAADSPYFHLSEDPAVCYEGTSAVNVTGCLRRDGHIIVQCLDLSGKVFGCSALYLRVVPR